MGTQRDLETEGLGGNRWRWRMWRYGDMEDTGTQKDMRDRHGDTEGHEDREGHGGHGDTEGQGDLEGLGGSGWTWSTWRYRRT